MSSLENSGPLVAQAALATIGGRPSATRHADESEQNWVDIARFANRPNRGYDTYSTLSLHITPNLLNGNDLRVEIVGVAPRKAEEFANLIATLAFFIVKDHWVCAPGIVFPGLIPRYYPGLSKTLEHVLFTEPFPWPGLSSVNLSGRLAVHWLLAVPISEAERQYLMRHGRDKLDELFGAHDLPYFDLSRRSIV